MIYIEDFKDIRDFASKIKRRPQRAIYTSESETGTKKFTGTDTYKQAEDLLLYGGWKTKDFRANMRKVAKLENNIKVPRNETYLARQGFTPCVPNALIGNPLNMYNTKKTRMEKAKVINVNYNVAFSHYFKPETVIARGTVILGAIRVLEKSGYRINLNYIRAVSDDKGNGYVVRIPLKTAREHFDLSKMAFPLAHPSMLRRLVFKWQETNLYDGIDNIASGYGTPLGASSCTIKNEDVIKHLKGKTKEQQVLINNQTMDIKDESDITEENIVKYADMILKGGA